MRACLLLLLVVLCVSAERPTFKLKPSVVPNPNSPLVVYHFFDGVTRIDYEVVHSSIFFLDSEDHIVSVKCQGTVMQIETSPNYQLVISPNTTLVGSAEWKCPDETGRTDTPLYRNLVSISAPWKSGNNFIYTAQTTYAGVADCFEDGSVMNISSSALNTAFIGNQSSVSDVTRDFGWNYDAKTGKAEKSIELWSAGKSQVDCSNCWIDLEYGMSIGVSFGRKDLVIPYLKNFHADISGSAKLNTEITAIASGSAKSSGSKLIATIPLPGFTFFIGIVPVKIEFAVPINVGYSFSASATASLVTGYDVAGSAGIGLTYANNQWVPSAERSFVQTFHKPAITKSFNASASAFIEAAINMEFYGVAGAQFSMQRNFYNNMTLAASCPSAHPHITASEDLRGSVDAILTKPIHLQSPSFTVFNDVKSLYNQCF